MRARELAEQIRWPRSCTIGVVEFVSENYFHKKGRLAAKANRLCSARRSGVLRTGSAGSVPGQGDGFEEEKSQAEFYSFYFFSFFLRGNLDKSVK